MVNFQKFINEQNLKAAQTGTWDLVLQGWATFMEWKLITLAILSTILIATGVVIYQLLNKGNSSAGNLVFAAVTHGLVFILTVAGLFILDGLDKIGIFAEVLPF